MQRLVSGIWLGAGSPFGNKYIGQVHQLALPDGKAFVMSIKVLNEVRDTLIQMEIVKNEPEFCVGWLGRGIGYMRTLRFVEQDPSAEAMAILVSKLGHYGQRLAEAGADRADWAETFARLHQRCQLALEAHAQRCWATEGRMGYGA